MGLLSSGLPLLLGSLRLVLGVRQRLDEHVAGALLRDGLAGGGRDADACDPPLRWHLPDDLADEVLAVGLQEQVGAHVIAVRQVGDALLIEKLREGAAGGRLAPVQQLEHRIAVLRLDGTDQVARLGGGERVEVRLVRGVGGVEPAEQAAGGGREVVAHLARHLGEVLAGLDPLASVFGGRAGLRSLGPGWLGRLLRVRLVFLVHRVGELDQDEAGADPFRQTHALGHFGVDRLVADRDPEVGRPCGEHGPVHQGVGCVRRDLVEAGAQAVDLLLDELVARPTVELGLQLGEGRHGLGGQDALTLNQVAAIEALLRHDRDRTEVRLPVAVPGRRSEDPQGQGDGQREAQDRQLLRAQLVLPARAVLPVEDRSGSDRHRLRSCSGPGGGHTTAADGEAPC